MDSRRRSSAVTVIHDRAATVSNSIPSKRNQRILNPMRFVDDVAFGGTMMSVHAGVPTLGIGEATPTTVAYPCATAAIGLLGVNVRRRCWISAGFDPTG